MLSLQGVHNVLAAEDAQVSHTMVDLSLDLEREDYLQAETYDQDTAPCSTTNRQGVDMSVLKPLIDTVSVEVAESTHKSYQRVMANFQLWIHSNGLLPKEQDIFSGTPHVDSPFWIVAYIMKHCDSFNPDGTHKHRHDHIATYSHAMKIRSSLTFGYGRCYETGARNWVLGPEGTWTGNPSVSTVVARYMVSLKRRKIKTDGTIAMSSKAISPDIITKIYKLTWESGLGSNDRFASEGKEVWRNHKGRALVHAIVTVAFVCLLRVDEVLKLRYDDVKIDDEGMIKIFLPSRKTAQFGEIRPFPLWAFHDVEEALCPVRALANWISLSGVSSGYLFRAPGSRNRQPSFLVDKPLSSPTFLEMFRNILLDVDVIDPSLYGGHSLRRGGCQWLAHTKKWSFADVCDWGGWSKEGEHLTIMKYLFSLQDDPQRPREYYFMPNQPLSVSCPQCNRTCPCA